VTAPAAATWADHATAVGGALIALGSIVWSFDLPLKLGLLVYTEQFIAAVLGLALAIGYLRWQQGARPRWYRLGLALVALGAGAWLAIRYPTLQADVLSRRGEATALAVVLLVLLIDTCRRSAGVALAFVFAFFFAYALLGHHFSGMLQTKEVSVFRLLTYLALDTSSMLGVALIIACTTVVAFMFFGKLLQTCGGGEFFTDLSSAAFGRYRGGSGKVEVVASALFGTISGSAVANVMSTGIITIPSMKRAGYSPVTAGAIESVSSTGGQIMPPVMGAAAFLMAENLQVRYAEVALAALVPAILFYVAVFAQVDYEAARRRIGGLDPATLPRAGAVLRQGWFFLVPFVVLFYLMFSANLQAEEAVLWGAAAMMPFAAVWGYRGQRLTWRGFLHALAQTGRDAVEILVICAVAGCVIGLLNITGLALGLGLSLVKLGENSVPLLLLAVAVICVVLGMGLPTTGVYLLVALLAAPPLVKLGVPPMAAHMFVFFYGCLSMITPPVAMAAYAAAHIAQAPPMKVGWRACQLGWPAFALPFVFAWSPTLLLIGHPLDVAVAVLSAAVGVWLGSAAVAGYFVRPLAAPQRLAFALAALMLILPGHGFPGAGWVELAGAALAAVLVARETRARDAPSRVVG
jgi:TRAP transporter 4TM/12TM fusion protein